MTVLRRVCVLDDPNQQRDGPHLMYLLSTASWPVPSPASQIVGMLSDSLQRIVAWLCGARWAGEKKVSLAIASFPAQVQWDPLHAAAGPAQERLGPPRTTPPRAYGHRRRRSRILASRGQGVRWGSPGGWAAAGHGSIRP